MESVIPRLNRILTGLFGVEASYRELTEITASDWDLSPLAGFDPARATPKYILNRNGDQIGFPVKDDGRLGGFFVVPHPCAGDDKRLSELVEFVVLIVETSRSMTAEIERLDQLESRMRLGTGEAKNIIPFRQTKRDQESPASALFTSAMRGLNPRAGNAKPMLVRATRYLPFRHLAVELHQQIGRGSLIQSSDLPESVFASTDSIRALGAMTIVIADLAAMTIDQQKVLAEFLKDRNPENDPLVLACVCESPEELVNEGLLVPGIAERFTFARIRMEDYKGVFDIDHIAYNLRKLMEEPCELPKRATAKFIPFHAKYLDPKHPTLH